MRREIRICTRLYLFSIGRPTTGPWNNNSHCIRNPWRHLDPVMALDLLESYNKQLQQALVRLITTL